MSVRTCHHKPYSIMCVFFPLSYHPRYRRGKVLQEAGDSPIFFFSPSWMKSFHREIFLANCQLIWSLESSYLNSTGQFFCQTHLADLHSQWENHHLQPPLGCCAHFWTFNSSSLWFCLFICTVLNRVCPGGNVRLTGTTQNNCIIGNVTMTAVIKADNKTKAH